MVWTRTHRWGEVQKAYHCGGGRVDRLVRPPPGWRLMTGHPLLGWQREWQAYLRGHRCAMTDWTDGAVGGYVGMTGRIFIWVKNLVNVGERAREEGRAVGEGGRRRPGRWWQKLKRLKRAVKIFFKWRPGEIVEGSNGLKEMNYWRSFATKTGNLSLCTQWRTSLKMMYSQTAKTISRSFKVALWL